MNSTPAPDGDVPFPNGIDPSNDDVELTINWEDVLIPAGKSKGKRLDELTADGATWWCRNYRAKRFEDMPFRKALNECARALKLNISKP